MKLRIRIKFIGILMLASVLPLCLALFAAQTLGYRYYRRAQGMLFQVRAEHLASGLSLAVNEQVNSLAAWVAMREMFPEETDSMLEILLHLDRLRRTVKRKFPRAKSFHRPGFDDKG